MSKASKRLSNDFRKSDSKRGEADKRNTRQRRAQRVMAQQLAIVSAERFTQLTVALSASNAPLSDSAVYADGSRLPEYVPARVTPNTLQVSANKPGLRKAQRHG